MKASYRKYLKFAVFGILAFCGVMLGNVEDAAAAKKSYYVTVASKDGGKWLCSGEISGEPNEKGYELAMPSCGHEDPPVNFIFKPDNKDSNTTGTFTIYVDGRKNKCGAGHYHKEVKFDGTGFNYNPIEIDEVVNKFVGNIGSDTLKCEDNEAAISAFSSRDKAQEFLDNYKPVDPGDPDPDKVEQNCGNGGGAQSLGWIVCTVMTWAGEASEGLYNEFVEPALQVEPQLFTSGNGNTLKGWGTFRDIANVVFVILLLAVIFSQLTGVGINNYGVKKILPKLIVMAVLINLSYFICVALIDVSNILGNGLQALFDELGSGLDPALTIEESDNIKDRKIFEDGNVGADLVSLGVAGLLVTTMVGTVWGNPAIVLTLFISIVGVAISIMMLFILLAAREAAIVVLVVISPLAVICYALPNTKSLFTKWLNIFKALLILYPVAGLLVGGGNYVSSLLLTVGMGEGVFTAVTAMLAGIVPIFFIPSLTKNAFSGLGNLGAKIGNIGDKARRGATQGMTNSRLNKHMQERGAMRRDNLRAGMKKDKNGNLVPTRTGKLRNRFANTRLGNAVGYAAALGTRKEQSTKKADAEQAAKDWNKEFYTHDDGAVYAKDKNGEWSYVSGGDPKKAAETLTNETVQNNLAKRRQQKADAEAAGKKYNGLPAGLTSYSQGIANQNKIDRAENLGKVAANANMKDADNVARAAMRASGVAAGDAIEDKLVAGQRDVLQVKHDKAVEQRKQVRIEGQEGYVAKSDDAIRLDIKNNNNATTGANQAVAEAIVEAGSLDKVAASVETAQVDKADQLNAAIGKNQAVAEAIARADGNIASVAKSVEENRQAAESQFIDVASGNDAARFTSKSAEQIQQAVDVGSQKLQNQNIVSTSETEAYAENIEKLAVNRDNAKNLAKKRIFTTAADNDIPVVAPEYEQIKAAAESKYNKELLESEIANIKSNETIDVGHYKTELQNLLSRDPVTSPLSKQEELKAKAYMRLMADSGSFGQKEMVSVVANSSQREFAAKFMSKDADIRSAINVKNPALAQYLREANANEQTMINGIPTDVKDISFDQWLEGTHMKNGAATSDSNAQFVANDITDKDEDIIRQSDSTFEDMLNAGVYTDDRLSAIYNNKDVYNAATKKVRTLISNKLGRPYDQAEYDPRNNQP